MITVLKKPVERRRLLVLLPCILFLFFACNDFTRNKSHLNVPVSNIEKGKELAARYCKSCHMLPDPSFLDSKSWAEGVLPNMGPLLGIFDFGFHNYPSFRNDPNLPKNFYPAQPLLSLADWQYIIDYYSATSPDSLPGQSREKPIHMGMPDFEVHVPSPGYPSSAVSFIKIDTAAFRRSIMLYDITLQKLLWFDARLNATDSLYVKTPVVDAKIKKENLTLCNIGVMNPNNGKYGSVQTALADSAGHFPTDPGYVLDSLARPVCFQIVDLNGDGRQDYIVSEFGYLRGELAWYEDNGQGHYQKHVLRDLPGAVSLVVNDYNHDGMPDIWALFAQGDEGVFLFTNKGKGQFAKSKLLEFPPMQGSTYFELDDFNGDGHPDILYTCGDNADFSPVLKPYHGVYIFLNDGENNFTKRYFFPVHGCFKAMACDFDRDGDLDIAAISFFADYSRQPEEGFVYLKNTGDLKFDPYSFPAGKTGRWLTMDAGDYDGDGKTDLVIGNFSIRLVNKDTTPGHGAAPPFIILKNITP